MATTKQLEARKRNGQKAAEPLKPTRGRAERVAARRERRKRMDEYWMNRANRLDAELGETISKIQNQAGRVKR
jgi:hypothetical protein